MKVSKPRTAWMLLCKDQNDMIHNKKKSLLSSLFLLLLIGCGEEDKTLINTPTKPTIAINTQDIIYRMPLAKEQQIDFKDYTQSVAVNPTYHLRDFVTLTESDRCQQYQLSDTALTLLMSEAGECYYQYTMQETTAGYTSTSLLRVSANTTTMPESLRIFNVHSELNQSVSIDVFQYDLALQNYEIDVNSLQILGIGEVRLNELDPKKIIFHAGNNKDAQGIQQVLFSYINTETQSTIPGMINVAVNTTINNHPPKAVNFRYGDRTGFVAGQQLDYQIVDVDEEVTINIAPYFSEGYVDSAGNSIALTDDQGNIVNDGQGNPIHYYLLPDEVTSSAVYQPGSFLIDLDKDKLQLINVQSYDAYVGIDAEAGFTNTEFTFKSQREGLHYVTYTLSDHNGAYGIGVIEIQVGEPMDNRPWQSYFYTNSSRFMAPLNQKMADRRGLFYGSVSNETGTTGPDGFGTPLFDYYTAKRICETSGLRLPTTNELTGLKTDYANGLFSSFDRYNPVESDRQKSVNWPTKAYYWTLADEGLTSTDTVSLANFSIHNGNISSTVPDYNAVTCISPGKISEITIVENDAKALPFGEYNKVKVKVTDYANQPLANESVTPLLNQKLVLKIGQSLKTDNNGELTLLIGSLTAQNDVSTSFAFYDDFKSLNGLNFKSANYYIRQVPNLFCLYEQFSVMAEDNNCENSQETIPRRYTIFITIFHDGEYVYKFSDFDGKLWLLVYQDLVEAGLGTANYIYRYDTSALLGNNNLPFEDRSRFMMLYDNNYYWAYSFMSGSNRFEAYNSVFDMLNRSNIQKSINITDPNQSLDIEKASYSYMFLPNYNESGVSLPQYVVAGIGQGTYPERPIFLMNDEFNFYDSNNDWSFLPSLNYTNFTPYYSGPEENSEWIKEKILYIYTR